MLVAEPDDRTDHRKLVRRHRQPGQQLTELDARNPGRDRLELSAHLFGSVDLEIERDRSPAQPMSFE